MKVIDMIEALVNRSIWLLTVGCMFVILFKMFERAFLPSERKKIKIPYKIYETKDGIKIEVRLCLGFYVLDKSIYEKAATLVKDIESAADKALKKIISRYTYDQLSDEDNVEIDEEIRSEILNVLSGEEWLQSCGIEIATVVSLTYDDYSPEE